MWDGLLALAERGRLPDVAIRYGIRRLLAERLNSLPAEGSEAAQAAVREFIAACDAGPIAALPEKANVQHYEVPAGLFQLMLGPRLKYSSCHWGPGVNTLSAAEEAALSITCERAQLQDGQAILELGCGWGSLSLWMAEKYQAARITAVSNSRTQREFIVSRAQERGLANLTVITADMNGVNSAVMGTPAGAFDRVVSVEMFEHMRNQRLLLARIADWLKPGGKLFVHIFCHRSHPYSFVESGPADWMTRYFFAGGMMPSDALLLRYQQALSLQDQWRWSGRHYERTCNAWLERLDERHAEVESLLRSTYGADGPIWRQRWRMFLMACAELFGYHHGREWFVSHYLFGKPT